MNDHDQIRFEVERDERWLAGRLAVSEPVDLDRIRLRARVAIGEQWLAERLKDEPPDSLESAARIRVRNTLRETRTTEHAMDDRTARHRRRWVAPTLAFVGLAAALLFLVTSDPFGLSTVHVATKIPDSSSERDSDLVALGAFEQAAQTENEFDETLQQLEQDLTELGQRVAGSDADANSPFESFWDTEDSFEFDGEDANQPVGAVWRVRESGV